MEILIGLYVAISLGITVKYSAEQMRLSEGWSIRENGESRVEATKKLAYVSLFGGVLVVIGLLKAFGESLSSSVRRAAN